MRKILLSVIALITWCYHSMAQTGNFGANYMFQINQGTYTALTTPTVLSSGSGMDDGVFTVTLNNPFNLFGVANTTVTVTENGYLAFGDDPDSYYPLSNTVSGNIGIVAPFGRDLGGIDASSQLSWAQIGNEAVFEWKNMKRYSSSTGEVLNFQARLNTSTGVIKFVYGSTSVASGSSSTYPQVGIRSSDVIWDTDVNNLTIANTSGNCSWANATTGSSNTSTMYLNTTNAAVAPVSGLEYIWTPSTLTPPVRTIAAVSSVGTTSVVLNFTQPAGTPTGYNVQYRIANSCSWTNAVGNPFGAASTLTLTGLASSTNYEYRIQTIYASGNSIYSPVNTFTTLAATCAGIPTAGTAVSTNTSICSSTNFTLSLSGSSTGVSGLTYQWQSSPDNSTWTSIPSATMATAVVSQTTTTYYQAIITCTASVATATSTSVQVIMNSFLNCYCTTSPSSGGTNDIITNVMVTNSLGQNLTQASTYTAPAYFVSYNNTPLDLVQGSTSNTVSITMGSDGTQHSAAWIDFNRNGIYEVSENIALSTSSAGGNATVNYTFTVPAGASLGNTRMRVRGGSDAAYSTNACSTTSYGETEDYLVNIIIPPTCYAPNSLTTSNVTASSVTVSWTTPTSGTPSSYITEVRTSGSAGSGTLGLVSSNTIAVPATSVNITGLTGLTAYTVYVKSDCGLGDLSAWTSNTFTTLASCPVTSSITMSSITPTSAIAGWTAGGSENAWDVYYGYVPLATPTASTAATATTSATSYTLNGLTPSTNYSIYVRANCGTGNKSIWTPFTTFMTPCLPPNITGTMPNSRCGIGTVTLGVTADPGSVINWYTAATGGTAIATGSVLTTPVISTTTPYYAEAGNVSMVVEKAGIPSITANSSTNSNYGDHGIIFSTTKSNVTVLSAKLYVVGTGSVIISLRDDADNELASTAAIAVTGSGSVTPVTVPINLTTTVPGEYSLIMSDMSGGITDMYVEDSPSYPYSSPSGNVSVIAGYWYGFDDESHRYFYDIEFQYTGLCASTRTMVTATVNTPPVLSVTSGTTVCTNVIKPLNITSTLSNYDNYTWSPGTNLYTNSGATTPYSGANATTLYYSSPVSGSTTYTITATNSVNGCANTATTTMIADMPSVNASANPMTLCSGTTVTLTAGPYANATLGTATSTTSGSGVAGGSYISPFSHYFGGYKGQYIITATELLSAGLSAGNITAMSYSVASTGTTYTDFAISMGTTTQSVATSSFININTQVYGPNNITPVVGLNTYNFSTPFNWDGTSNIVVQVCWSNNNTGGAAAEVYYGSTSYPSTTYERDDNLSASGMCGITTGASPISNRPLLIFKGGTAAAGPVNWQWNPGSVNSNTMTVTPTNTGSSGIVKTYTVTAIDPATTCTNSVVVNFTVNPYPTVFAAASQTLLCDNGSSGSSVLTAFTSATTYSWSDGATTMTTSVTPTLTTTYTVTVTESGCSADAYVTVTVSNCNGVQELVANAINIYPNPTHEHLNISLSTELAGSTSIEVYDAVGKLVMQEVLSTGITSINTSKLEDGMYMFKIINNNKSIKVGKIVKQ